MLVYRTDDHKSSAIPMIKPLKFIPLFLLPLLSGCLFHPYSPPVQQGNVITNEMISQLKPGMTPEQVSYLLGSPDVVDPYHTDDWYYVYTYQKSDLPRTEKQLVIYFKNNRVDTISGNVNPPSPLHYQAVSTS